MSSPKNRILLRNVRVAFVQSLFVPEVYKDGKDPTPYHNIKALIEPSDPQLKALEKVIDEAAKEKFGQKWQQILEAAKKMGKCTLQDGDTKAEWGGFEGMMFVSARTPESQPPKLIGPQKQILKVSDGRPYAGCYCNVLIDVFGYLKPVKGIGARLKGVQYVKDGDAFGGGAPAKDDEFPEEDLADTGADEEDLAN